MTEAVRKAIEDGSLSLTERLSAQEAGLHQKIARDISRRLMERQKNIRGMVKIAMDSVGGLGGGPELSLVNSAQLNELEDSSMQADRIAAIRAEKKMREVFIGIAKSAKKIARGTLLLRRKEINTPENAIDLEELISKARKFAAGKTSVTRQDIIRHLLGL